MLKSCIEEADKTKIASLAGIEATIRAETLEYITPQLGVFYRTSVFLMTIITLNKDSLEKLDITPVKSVLEPILSGNELLEFEQKIQFKIEFTREETDPRELSEIPEVRLWFVRVDSVYPWLLFFLNSKEGELARYTAMLVPHEFNRTDGIKYNSEALEIFVMQKIFILSDWLKQKNISTSNRLKSMTQMLGYEIDEAFFEMV